MEDRQAPGYQRELERRAGRTLVASTCLYCALKIVGSVPAIGQDEWDHRKKCKKQRGKKSIRARSASTEN